MIKLCKHAFYNENETRKRLSNFITDEPKYLSIGTEIELFEKQYAEWQGRKHAVMVNSGSSANLAILQTLLNLGRLRRHDYVAVSSLTWSTNVMPIIQLGLIPVFVDIDIHTLNVSPRTFQEAMNKNMGIRAFFITHALGFCDNIEAISIMCKSNDIILLEDTCESMGSIASNNKLGNWGLASTFSTFVGHHMSTIEGGIICTDDEEVNISLRRVREHGWNRRILQLDEDKSIYPIEEFYAKYSFEEIAFNLRPTEISGFLGNDQIITLDAANLKREKNFYKLFAVGRENNDLVTPRLEHMNFISNYAYPFIARDHEIHNKYFNLAMKKNIEIRPMLGGAIETQPFYVNWHKKHMNCNYPMSDAANFVWNYGFYLPNNPHLDDHEIEQMQSVLRGE